MKIYFIKDAKKLGPISAEELVSLVQEKYLQINDQISIDDGKTFMAIHASDFMAQIKTENNKLPKIPESIKTKEPTLTSFNLKMEMEDPISERVSFFKSYPILMKSSVFSMLIIFSFYAYKNTVTTHSSLVNYLKVKNATQDNNNGNTNRAIASLDHQNSQSTQNDKAYMYVENGITKMYFPKNKRLLDAKKMEEISTEAEIENE